jgi:hypothetical protein
LGRRCAIPLSANSTGLWKSANPQVVGVYIGQVRYLSGNGVDAMPHTGRKCRPAGIQ